MRYEEIINEAATFRSFFTALKRDCSEYIDLIKGKKRMLYRGLKTHDSPLLKLASRENRKPKDSSSVPGRNGPLVTISWI